MPKRKYYRKIYKKKKKKRIFLVLKFFGVGLFVFLFSILFLFLYYANDLPRPERFEEKQFLQPTKIYDREGKVLLYEIYGKEKRTIVPLEKVPQHLINAVIVAEDANFYKHFGIDIKGMARAFWVNLKLGKPVQGGSTIPQQLIRSSFLTREKTIKRKIREIILTIELDRRYSKNQILEWYLNQIPFGGMAYGVEEASETYFNKSVSDLSLAEAAVLASLIRAPSYLSPYGEHRDKLFIRKDYIIERMAKEGFINKEEAERAKKEELKFAKITQSIKAPHFVFYVQDYLFKKYGKEFLEEGGFKVYTTLDWELQDFAQNLIKEKMKANQAYNAFNASLVAIDPNTGQILAMVGSKDYFEDPWPLGCSPKKNCLFEPEVNVATYGKGRQPGSAFKPFAYAQALRAGFTPETILWDVETNFGVKGTHPYIPKNYDKKFRGPISLKNALAQSINVPSVKVLYLAGQRETIKLAKAFGITTLNKDPNYYGLSLVLGGGGVKLLDMTSAYGVFATEGLKISPSGILKIEDQNGNIIEENRKTPKRVIEAEPCRLINDILSDNKARAPMFGAKSPLYFKNFEVAAKTGTAATKDGKVVDAWTIGYTPSVAVGVWVGNNDNTPMAEKPAVILAGPIFHQFMEKILSKYPKKNFKKPQSISTDKPVLQGKIDKSSPHSILHYVYKKNPQGEPPQNPESDFQYNSWEEGVKRWVEENWTEESKETENLNH